MVSPCVFLSFQQMEPLFFFLFTHINAPQWPFILTFLLNSHLTGVQSLVIVLKGFQLMFSFSITKGASER